MTAVHKASSDCRGDGRNSSGGGCGGGRGSGGGSSCDSGSDNGSSSDSGSGNSCIGDSNGGTSRLFWSISLLEKKKDKQLPLDLAFLKHFFTDVKHSRKQQCKGDCDFVSRLPRPE